MQGGGREAMVEDWASLPKDVLDPIFDLLHYRDWIPFSDVCFHWRTIAYEKFRDPCRERWLRRHLLRTGGVLPFLLHRVDTGEAGTTTLSTYNAAARTSVGELELTSSDQISFWGCSCGWLIMHKPSTSEVCLLNPLSHRRIPLPVFSRSAGYGIKGVLSQSPESGFVLYALMVIYGPERRLAFIRSVYKKWAYIGHAEDQFVSGVEDINYSNGLFFALCNRGHDLIIINVRNLMLRKLTQRIRPRPSQYWCGLQSIRRKLARSPNHVFHLVKYWDGRNDKFLRVLMKPNDDLVKTKFQVYKLGNGGEWFEVRNLGDVSLFLGDVNSASLSISTHRRCRPNSIYFCHGNRIGVFGLEDGRVSPLRNGISLQHHMESPTFWLVPTFEYVEC